MTLREWLTRAPIAVAFSSSYFGFFAHGGAWRALAAAGIEPAHLSGASAGAVAAAAWASGLDAGDFRRAIDEIGREDLWDPGPGIGLLRGRRLRARIRSTLPVERIEDCRIPLAISVFDVFALRTRALTGGPIAAAVQASCAVPLMFHPVRLERVFLDGGVRDPGALAGVPAGLRVLQLALAPESRRPSRLETRDGRVRAILSGHPRPGLFRLGRGPAAGDAAEDAMTALLDQDVDAR